MKDRFLRTKNFVRDHKVGIALGTGVVVGITVMMVTRTTPPNLLTRLKVSSDMLQQLIDNPNGVISFDPSPTEKIWIINAANTDVL